MMVRSLGLPENLTDSSFHDVAVDDWYGGAVQTAVDYGLITGYPDNAFGPNEKITREQAMTMISRAMSVTALSADALNGEDTLNGEEVLNDYLDHADVSSYAREAAAACIQTGIISGRGNSMLAPKAYMTRVEAVVMIRRLLERSNLI